VERRRKQQIRKRKYLRRMREEFQQSKEMDILE